MSYITEDERGKCHAIIHTASVAAAGIGTGLANIPLSDTIPLQGIQITMIIALGKVFEMTLTEAMAKRALSSFLGATVGKGIANVLTGWIPGIGNIINASVAASMTETIGWIAAEQFAKELYE